jgi:hypothetical protein
MIKIVGLTKTFKNLQKIDATGPDSQEAEGKYMYQRDRVWTNSMSFGASANDLNLVITSMLATVAI